MNISNLFLVIIVSTLAIMVPIISAQSKAPTMEEILAWEIPQDVLEKYPYYLSGYDYEDSPVWIGEVGKWDVRAAVERGGEYLENYRRHVQQMFARGTVSARNHTEGGVGIMDMEGFVARQATHPGTILVWLEAFRWFQETVSNGDMKQGIIINANFLFVQLFQVAKPLLGELQKDVEIHGTNPQKWIPRLLKLIPKDQLPQHMGGNKGFKPLHIYG